jgi:hypothetical protein
MSYTITDIKNAVSRRLHGTTANQLTDFYGLLYDTATKCLDDCDFEETRRTVQLTTPIYGQASFEYACPSDLKGNRLIDLRPQANRSPSDVPTQQFSQAFDTLKTQVTSGSRIETRWNGYIKTLRIALPALDNVLLNSCDSITGNGTWTAGAGASALADEDIYFVQGAGSLKYSLTNDGYLENSTMSVMDLTNYQDRAVLFAWVYNEATLPTSFTLRWGSDSANYWTKTVTTQWDGTAFRVGWNLVGFDWQTATKTLNPVVTAIDYLRFYTAITGSATPVYFDSVTASLGSIYEIEYYSKYLFRDLAGAFKEKVTLDSDLVNLDMDSYGVFTNCLAMLAAQQQQGKDSAFDLAFFQKQYADSVLSYNQKYPSQAQKTVGSYYQVRRSSYASKLGGITLRP